MSNKTEILEKNIAKVDITIEAEAAKKAYDNVISKMSRQVNIPGFRKGKAPKNVVEKYIGQERAKVQVVEDLFPIEFSKAVSDNNLDPAVQPVIESFNFDLGKDLTIVAKVELKPEVELAKYKENELEYTEYKTPDNAMEIELEAIKGRFATIKPIEEDREAKDTDLALIDFEGFVDGKPIERGEGKNYTLDLGNSNFIPGFAEGIMGHKKGEEFTIDVTFPENYSEESLKGAKAQFKIKLHELQERILPELTDELVKKLGRFESVDQLKEDIQKYLENSTQQENEKRKMEVIFNKILDETKIDIQDTMIEREVEAVLEETKMAAENQGQNWEAFVQTQGEESLNAQAKEEAIKRIKNSLIIEKIAKTEGIKVEQNDIIEQVTTIAQAYGTTPKDILKELTQNQHFFTAITQQIAIKKVNDVLLKNNNFIAK